MAACKFHTSRLTVAGDLQDGLFQNYHNEIHRRNVRNVSKSMRKAQTELSAAMCEAIIDPRASRPKKWVSPKKMKTTHASEPRGMLKAERRESFVRPLVARSALDESSVGASSLDFPHFGLHDMLDRRGLDTGNARVSGHEYAPWYDTQAIREHVRVEKRFLV